MQFDEGPPHPLRIGESHRQSDLFDRFAPRLQTQPRRFNAQALDRLSRCFTRFPAKCSSELSQTQSCGIGEPFDGERLGQMFPGKIQGDADTIRFRLHVRHGRELGLTAGSTIRNNQKPGDSARNVRAPIFFDHAEREIYS